MVALDDRTWGVLLHTVSDPDSLIGVDMAMAADMRGTDGVYGFATVSMVARTSSSWCGQACSRFRT